MGIEVRDKQLRIAGTIVLIGPALTCAAVELI